MMALSSDHPLKQAMKEFYDSKSDLEILQMLESDPHYMQRKRELNSLLTSQVVARWAVERIHQIAPKGYALVFYSTCAIVRAVEGKSKPGDFAHVAPLTLEELKKIFPTSSSLVTHENNDAMVFVTVGHVVPRGSCEAQVPHLVVHHTLRRCKKGIFCISTRCRST